MNVKDTLFFEKAVIYQSGKARTKEAGIRKGQSILVIGIVMLVLGLVLRPVISQMLVTPLAERSSEFQREVAVVDLWPFVSLLGLAISWISIIVGSMTSVIGLVRTGINTFRPTKTITCIQCGTNASIYRGVTQYMCVNCGEMLLLDKKSEKAPEFSVCPYCEMRTAVVASHGYFRCPNCGITRHSDEEKLTEELAACSNCNRAIPNEALYCSGCGTILQTEFSLTRKQRSQLPFDEDWKIGKDAKGHLYYAKALLMNIQAKTKGTATLDKIVDLFVLLEEALISFEIALKTPDLKQDAEALLPEIDTIYASILEAELRSINMPTSVTVLIALRDESYIKARRRIESIVGQSLKSLGSIGEWSDKLIDLTGSKKDTKILSKNKLKTEIDRFSAWKADRNVGAGGGSAKTL